MPAAPKASRPHMPGYGIKPATEGKGLLPWSWAQDRLVKARVYWLSTVRPSGSPHCMPVWAVWHDDSLIFSTGSQSQKARNLATNPLCTIGLGEGDEAVVVEGKAELVNDEKLWPLFAESYKAKYGFDMSGMKSEPGYVFRPIKAFGLTTGLADSATRWTFEA